MAEEKKVRQEMGKAPKKEEKAQKPINKEKAEKKQEPKKEAKVKTKKTKEEIEAELRGLSVIRFPLITEKAVNMIETENKLVFVVDDKAGKEDVKKAIESVYSVKVSKVNIIKDMKARKKAIVSIDKKYKADDIATKLGVI